MTKIEDLHDNPPSQCLRCVHLVRSTKAHCRFAESFMRLASALEAMMPSSSDLWESSDLGSDGMLIALFGLAEEGLCVGFDSVGKKYVDGT